MTTPDAVPPGAPAARASDRALGATGGTGGPEREPSGADACVRVLRRLAQDAEADTREHVALTPAEARDIASRIVALTRDVTLAKEAGQHTHAWMRQAAQQAGYHPDVDFRRTWDAVLHRLTTAEAERGVLRGDGCEEERAGEGRTGPCGVCVKCLRAQVITADARRADVKREHRATLRDLEAALAARDASEAHVARLRAALTACADELEAEVRARHGWPEVHPSQRRRYERDMASVHDARAALESVGAGTTADGPPAAT